MRALPRWLSAILGSRKQDDLPAELVSRLADKSFAAIQGQMQALLQTRPDTMDQLLRAVHDSDWPSMEIKKLAAFGYFYRGELCRAYELAAPNCGGQTSGPFDQDLFMVAILSLYHNGQFEEAWRLLLGLAKSEANQFSDQAAYFSIKSSIALANNRLDDAWDAIQEARRLQPADASTALNAYALAFRLPDLGIFQKLNDEITAGLYGGNLNALALATPVLAQDDYVTGFRLLEGRYLQPDAQRYINPALPMGQHWLGRMEDWPRGETLLLSCEQGLGDTIQMARYFPALDAMTGGHLVVESHSELLPLLVHSFPAIRFVERCHGSLPAARFDWWIASLSLPFLFGSTATDIPGTDRYLDVAAENREYWQTRIEEMGVRKPSIGIAWSGNPAHTADRQRSIPFEDIAAILRSRPQQDFVALQLSVPADRPSNLQDLSTELITFADTAALVEQMDLVITVDTSVAHIAGALGKETWLLLPKRYEWRWSLEGEGNCWYDSVRVMRQERHGDWSSVLEMVFGKRLDAWLIGQ